VKKGLLGALHVKGLANTILFLMCSTITSLPVLTSFYLFEKKMGQTIANYRQGFL
jgi:uncharacterized membrane protein (GlpM family)